MTSPAPGVTRVEARCIREHGNLQREDQSLPRTTHPTTIIPDRQLTRRNREVVNFKRYRVKNYTELTNLMKMYLIQGYNGKYGSNPQGI